MSNGCSLLIQFRRHGEVYHPDALHDGGGGMRICRRVNTSDTLITECEPETTFSFVMPFRDTAVKDTLFTGISTAEVECNPNFVVKNGGVSLCNSLGYLLTCLKVLHAGVPNSERNCRAAMEFLPADETDRHDLKAVRLVVHLNGRNPSWARKATMPGLVAEIDKAMLKKTTPASAFLFMGKKLANVLLNCCVTLEHALLLALKPWDFEGLDLLFKAKCDLQPGNMPGDEIIAEIRSLLDGEGSRPAARVAKLRMGFMDTLDEIFQWRTCAKSKAMRAVQNTMDESCKFPGFTFINSAAGESDSNVVGDLTYWLSVLGVADSEITEAKLEQVTAYHPLARVIAGMRLTKATQYENSFFWLERLGVSHKFRQEPLKYFFEDESPQGLYRRPPADTMEGAKAIGAWVKPVVMFSMNFMTYKLALPVAQDNFLWTRMLMEGKVDLNPRLHSAQYSYLVRNYAYRDDDGPRSMSAEDARKHSVEAYYFTQRQRYKQTVKTTMQQLEKKGLGWPSIFDRANPTDINADLIDCEMYNEGVHVGAPSLVTALGTLMAHTSVQTGPEAVRGMLLNEVSRFITNSLAIWNPVFSDPDAPPPKALRALARAFIRSSSAARIDKQSFLLAQAAQKNKRARKTQSHFTYTHKDLSFEEVHPPRYINPSLFIISDLLMPRYEKLGTLEHFSISISRACVEVGYRRIPHVPTMLIHVMLQACCDYAAVMHMMFLGGTTVGKTYGVKVAGRALVDDTIQGGSFTPKALFTGNQVLRGIVLAVQEVGEAMLGDHKNKSTDSDGGERITVWLEALESAVIKRSYSVKNEKKEGVNIYGSTETTTNTQFGFCGTSNLKYVPGAFAARVSTEEFKAWTHEFSRLSDQELTHALFDVTKHLQVHVAIHSALTRSCPVLPAPELWIARNIIADYFTMVQHEWQLMETMITPVQQQTEDNNQHTYMPLDLTRMGSENTRQSSGQNGPRQSPVPPKPAMTRTDLVLNNRTVRAATNLVATSCSLSRRIFVTSWMKHFFAECTHEELEIVISAWDVASVGETLTVIATQLASGPSQSGRFTHCYNNALLDKTVEFALGLLAAERFIRNPEDEEPFCPLYAPADRNDVAPSLKTLKRLVQGGNGSEFMHYMQRPRDVMEPNYRWILLFALRAYRVCLPILELSRDHVSFMSSAITESAVKKKVCSVLVSCLQKVWPLFCELADQEGKSDVLTATHLISQTTLPLMLHKNDTTLCVPRELFEARVMKQLRISISAVNDARMALDDLEPDEKKAENQSACEHINPDRDFPSVDDFLATFDQKGEDGEAPSSSSSFVPFPQFQEGDGAGAGAGAGVQTPAEERYRKKRKEHDRTYRMTQALGHLFDVLANLHPTGTRESSRSQAVQHAKAMFGDNWVVASKSGSLVEVRVQNLLIFNAQLRYKVLEKLSQRADIDRPLQDDDERFLNDARDEFFTTMDTELNHFRNPTTRYTMDMRCSDVLSFHRKETFRGRLNCPTHIDVQDNVLDTLFKVREKTEQPVCDLARSIIQRCALKWAQEEDEAGLELVSVAARAKECTQAAIEGLKYPSRRQKCWALVYNVDLSKSVVDYNETVGAPVTVRSGLAKTDLELKAEAKHAQSLAAGSRKRKRKGAVAMFEDDADNPADLFDNDVEECGEDSHAAALARNVATQVRTNMGVGDDDPEFPEVFGVHMQQAIGDRYRSESVLQSDQMERIHHELSLPDPERPQRSRKRQRRANSSDEAPAEGKQGFENFVMLMAEQHGVPPDGPGPMPPQEKAFVEEITDEEGEAPEEEEEEEDEGEAIYKQQMMDYDEDRLNDEGLVPL